MKQNRYISMAAMLMFFAACQNDISVEDMQLQDQAIYTLSGRMGNRVNSRAQIQLGNQDVSGEYFMWNEGDSFLLYQGTDGVTFNISSDYSETAEGDKTRAVFNTTTPVYAGNYLAFYPASIPVEEDRFVLEFQRNLNFVDAKTQAERDAVWKEYFRNNMFMMAQGELVSGDENALQFQHLAALARITYHNESGAEQTMFNFALRGDQLYGTRKEYNMAGQHVAGGATTGFNMNLDGGLTIAAGDSIDLYLLFFPEQFREGDLELQFALNNGTRTASLPIADIAAANGDATGFQAGIRYWFDVTASKAGLVFSKDYSTAPIIIENVELSAALQSMYGPDMITIDAATGFGTMIEADVLGITRLDFGWGNYQIPSLKGIEHFKNLTFLSINSAGLAELDLSQNTKIVDVQLYDNQLVSLDLSKNLELGNLQLGSNYQLTSLNIDNCTQLWLLDVNETGLTSLNIPNKERIEILAYGRTALSFDLKEFPNVRNLSIYDLGLTSLDIIPKNVKEQLYQLQCYDNQIDSINLAEYPNMQYLSIYQNNFKSLDLTSAVNLQELNCHSCYIEKLDISPLENLRTLYCGQQKDNITLILIANDMQKEEWRNNWSLESNTWGLNDRAYLEGEEPKEIPEGSGAGSDFGNGGEF